MTAEIGQVYITGRHTTFNSFERAVLSKRRKNVEVVKKLPDKTEHLLPEALDFVNRFSPSEHLLFKAGMASIVRMQYVRDHGFPIPDGYIETNLDHTYSAEEIAREYHDQYPALRDSVNFAHVQKMLRVHDIGEAHVAIGDRPPADRTEEDEHAKRLEPLAGERLLNHIQDSGLREETIGYYREVTSKDKNNIDVQMAAFIDKVQGTLRVADVLFKMDDVDNRTQALIRAHLWEVLPKIQDHFSRVMVLLSDQDAREAMHEIGKKEFAMLSTYGPKEVAKAALQGIDATFPGKVVPFSKRNKTA